MLVYGKVIAKKDNKVKLNITLNNRQETRWFFVPQLCTVGDKSYNSYEIGTLVAGVLENGGGCVIGAIYNDEDICITSDSNIKMIRFSDGSIVQYNKSSHVFTLNILGNANITAQKFTINGDLEVVGNIKSNSDISDSKGSMQKIRDTFNSHTHGNGNNGANTSSPNDNM